MLRRPAQYGIDTGSPRQENPPLTCVTAVKMDDTQTVVIDNGSGWIKAGFAGEDAPQAVFPTFIGLSKLVGVMARQKEVYFGHEAQSRSATLSFTYPVEHGVVKDWDTMEKIWHYTFFNELRVNPEECSILLTEAPRTSSADREKMASIMFDVFSPSAICIASQAGLSLVASGCSSGVVVDVGDGVTNVTPFHEGMTFHTATERLEVAGRDITDHLKTLLAASGHELSRSTAQDIKEELCYVALDFNEETRKTPRDIKPYKLPDGSTIEIPEKIRFKAPELLFQPGLNAKGSDGVCETIHRSICKCDGDFRSKLYENIILAGGSTLFEGIGDRLQRDLSRLAPNAKVQVIAPAERKYSAWEGGSKFASLSGFSDCCVSKDEFDEHGPSVVHKKFQFF
ncbi:hypothetical protein BOTBODRAFT_353796 [Botryobasidium botryosum FD-172 SS1]|uniref:Actin n=1 Tax=Botryobasidium botryosum (strain FD-172 SS1) TaxID=930990 RepID=A0A067MRJ5_BOTB1|nr:hypothetical protein BOTBODRAFT_353796 [Botryobasidium botryosum FD-172 SS1]